MPTNSKNKQPDDRVNDLVKKVEVLQKRIKELENRGDHEIIYDGQHFFVNFPQLIQYFDGVARGGIRTPGAMGAVGAANDLAKILTLGEGDKFHEGVEKARQLILRYAGK